MEDAITPHVKRSLNPFMLYCKAERSNVADTGFSQVTTINKELGRRWKALSDEERKPYIDEAKRLKAQHKKDFPDYKYLPRKKVKKDAGPSVEKNERNSGPHASSTPYKVPSKSPKTSAVVKNLATGGSGMVPHPTYGSTLQAPGCTPNVYQTSGYQYQAAAPFYGLGNNQIAHGITEHQFQPPVPFQYQQQLCNYQPASLHNFDRSSSNVSASNDSVSGSSTPLGKAQAAECFNIYSSFVNYQQPTDCGVEYHGVL